MKELSFKESEEAMIKVLDNIQELIEESSLLLSNKKYPRAYLLAHIACEETAKIPMLNEAITLSLIYNENDWKGLYRNMRDHKRKIIHFLLTDKFFEHNTDDELINLIDNFERIDSKDINDMNDLKNNSLYAGFINNKFLEPSEVVTEEIATKQLKRATKLLKLFRMNFKQYLINLKALKENHEFREYYRNVSENVTYEF